MGRGDCKVAIITGGAAARLLVEQGAKVIITDLAQDTGEAPIARAAPVCLVSDFCLIFVPFGHYHEPEILPYAISLICSIGADVRQQPLSKGAILSNRGD